MDKRVANLVAYVVTAVWAASFIADVFMTTYEPNPSIHAIMLVVAGAAFGGSIVGKKK